MHHDKLATLIYTQYLFQKKLLRNEINGAKRDKKNAIVDIRKMSIYFVRININALKLNNQKKWESLVLVLCCHCSVLLPPFIFICDMRIKRYRKVKVSK